MYDPAAKPATLWLMIPSPSCRNATCAPSGADGLPAVYPEPLADTPLWPPKVQAAAVGAKDEISRPRGR